MKPARAAAGFVGAALAAGAWHILRNAAPPAWDDAWYLEISFRLFQALSHGPAAFAREYISAFHFKAPLISLLPLPLYAFAGPGERIAVWTSLAAHGATCALVFQAARSLWPEHPRRDEIAALSACVVALTPLLYGLSRLFLVESILTALVAASIWRLAAKPGRRYGVELGALLGFGMLAKVIFPLYLAGPVWLRRRQLLPFAGMIVIVGALVAGTWYAFNLPYVLGFAWSAGFGRVAKDYARHASGPLAHLAGFVGTAAGQALSWPLSAAGTAVAAAAAAAARRVRLDEGSRLVLAWTAPLLVLAVGVNQEVRFVAPFLPALALLAARAAMSFDARSARRAAAAALLAAGSFVFVRQTFLFPKSEALAYCGAPSADTGWDRAALVEQLAKDAGAGATAAVALEHPLLNANNLSSLAAAR
ncbi:MAG: hypothetical protein KGL74_09705, partial [Elusimicrobia bacterium]|nr:hypothetical protein [Elusimicrobiota bacterium]